MCNYCGCRDFPLIGRLSEEHWHIGGGEHGLFPASVIMLPIAAWDRVTPEPSAVGE
ncbi:hypothetical protein ACFFMN_35660 [Planobispora siamensis]|uniref:Uncharacterized protein n=1 Tax=Planobispora siamensis TaxID=936338 RepID=A0A8J3WLE5_9ACTN|nr:hypothetical protein [Planobispora siamensis]GIH95194.1 hypothetical protein Psi01_58240 [Planobispora siamensis]